MHYDVEFLRKRMMTLGLTQTALQSLWDASQLLTIQKGKQLMKAGKIEQYFYFIVKGIARIYIRSLEKEITFCFCAEADVLFSYNSFFNQTAGYETVELLEESCLLRISYKKIKELCERDLSTANFFNRLIGAELVRTEERLISSQSKSATERYADLIETNPQLIQRVQLGYIASYLGISQVTLSRIRAKFF